LRFSYLFFQRLNLFSIWFLVTFGVLVNISASSVQGMNQYNDNFYFIKRHIAAVLIGIVLFNIGKKITDQFKRYSLQIKPYDLRHAWAVRTILYDLPDTVAARMMGHSVSLHTQTYHHWITKRDQQQAVNNALLKVKRSKSI